MTTRKFNQLLVSLGVTITLLTNAYPQASRTVMVQSNTGVLLFPTNLWSANASSARSGLSLASHATNPVVPVASGGSGATNAATARTNLGLSFAALTNTNVTNFRSDIGLSWPALTNTNVTNFRSDIGLSWPALTNTNVTNFRSDIGLGWSALTNTNSANFRSAIGLGTFNSVVFESLSLAGALTATNGVYLSGGASISGGGSLDVRSPGNILAASFSSTNGQIFGNLTVLGSMSVTNSAQTRTNLDLGATWLTNTNVTNFRSDIGLSWPALTNTNSSVGLVGFTTNGNIVIANTNTNAITITNPIVLSGTADITTPIYLGATLGYFRVIGNTNTNTWALSYDGTNYFSAFSHNESQLIRLTSTNINYSVPIIFATNTASAETRTNLGLGATNDVTFSNIIVGSFFEGGSDRGFVGRNSDGKLRLRGTNVTTSIPAFFGWSGNETTAMSAEISRTNLSLGLPALTNTSNVTMMRALSGSTNTNHPFSGTISVVGTNNTNTLVFSNGILKEVQ